MPKKFSDRKLSIMRITVWELDKLVISIDPAGFGTEAELIAALDVQRHPDQEYFVRLEDGKRKKEFLFDGSDGLQFIGVLIYRGMSDMVFSLDIPCVETQGYLEEFDTPEQEIRI
jgi:hypothetical protein